MSNGKLPEDMPTISPPIWKRIIYSRPVEFITQIPPIPWISQKLTALTIRLARRKVVRDQIESPVDVKQLEQLTFNKEQHPHDTELNLIAHDIVDSLGFAGAMVAAYEQGDALPARAFYVNPLIASMDII
jgi:hypothetical protein